MIEISLLNPTRDVPEVARVYAEVFAGPPWNEWTKCAQEDRYFGKETQPGDSCPKCNSSLQLAYPLEPTMAYIKKETSRDGAFAFVGRYDGRIIAFSWMFNYASPEDFAREKYSGSSEMQQKIGSTLEEVGIDNDFAYYSETGILVPYRGQGLSNIFWARRIAEAERQRLPSVQRTRWDSPMTVVARRFNFQQLLGPTSYPMVDSAGNKTITRDGGVVRFLDTINPDRVLFRSP